MGLTQKTRDAEVTAVAISADGARIVTGFRYMSLESGGGAILWDARTGLRLGELKGLNDYVVAAAFTPDGARVVTVSGASSNPIRLPPRSVQIWDAKTGQLVGQLKKCQDAVASIDFSPDGKLLTGGKQGTVWNLDTGEPILELELDAKLDMKQPDVKKPGQPFEPPTLEFIGVAFRPDGERIVACSEKGAVRVWDAKKGQKPLLSVNLPLVTDAEMQPFLRKLDCVSFSPDGTRILVSAKNGRAKLADATTGAVLFELRSAPTANGREHDHSHVPVQSEERRVQPRRIPDRPRGRRRQRSGSDRVGRARGASSSL